MQCSSSLGRLNCLASRKFLTEAAWRGSCGGGDGCGGDDGCGDCGGCGGGRRRDGGRGVLAVMVPQLAVKVMVSSPPDHTAASGPARGEGISGTPATGAATPPPKTLENSTLVPIMNNYSCL